MRLPGQGIATGMFITMRHFVDTFVNDIGLRIRKGKMVKFVDWDVTQERQTATGRGIFTVQYPNEKLPVPENFRFIPFLVYEPKPEGREHAVLYRQKINEKGQTYVDLNDPRIEIGEERCTACGICAKVCPPQCIWIVRAVTKEGKPQPRSVEFYIDTDVCMNCGFCAEFCPFDAIKMDHNYELADYDRHTNHVYDVHKLHKPVSYYAAIHPTDYAREEAERAAKEAAKKK
jgi:NADH-quinone oxidoreductase subunit I